MSDHPVEPGDADDLRFVAELRAALGTAAAIDAIAAPDRPDRLLEIIVRAAARAIPCPEGALLLVDRERGVLTFDVVIGSTAAAVRDLTVPLGHGIAGLVAVSGQALAVANAQEDPRHARDIAELSRYLPTTILAVPVTSADGTPIGVLELLDRQLQPTFDLDDMELLSMFADQASIALDLRQTSDLLATRFGEAFAGLEGVPPEVTSSLRERLAVIASRIKAGDHARRARELATLVSTVAGRGPAEHEACVRVLRAFADYLDTRPALGEGMFE